MAHYPRKRFAFTTALLFLVTCALGSAADVPSTVYLDELKIENTYLVKFKTQRNLSTEGNPLSIGGVKFERGVGSYSGSILYIRLDGGSTRFSASVGVDDGVLKSPTAAKHASIDYYVYGDGQIIWKSGVMRSNEKPKSFDLDVTGMKSLVLVVDSAADSREGDQADWGDAKFTVVGAKPTTGESLAPRVEPVVLTPKAPATPRVNGPAVFGVRPGSAFLYTIPASGNRPMSFAVKNLPAGLTLDEKTGRITGQLAEKGEHRVTLVATNALGTAEKPFKIVCGDQIALTPPMGWNSWTIYGHLPSQKAIETNARLMVETGLSHHGWSYVNVDDNWQNQRPASDPYWKSRDDFFDPEAQGALRDENGELVGNKKFPSMKGMADYIHSLGLKAGLYCSPGPYACGNSAGCFQHEKKDAETFAKWGYDYLKYDWCYYNDVVNGKYPDAKDYPRWDGIDTHKPEAVVYPYRLMGKYLREQKRDIYFSACQYGKAYPWEWAGEAGANGWRTTPDIAGHWRSMSRIGFYTPYEVAPYQKPGQWNDPDTLVVGYLGDWKKGISKPSDLTYDEQYTQVSLWSLMSAPLLIGLDMTKMDDFTYGLLSNDEVIAIDQDSLGIQSTCKLSAGDLRVFPKPMEDGSLAIGFFNMYTGAMKQDFAEFAKLGLKGKYRVRDVWRQKDVEVIDAASAKLQLSIPGHGVLLYRLYPIK